MDDKVANVGARDVREQLQRILSSDGFVASARNRRFLEYVVEETLAGRADRIKAYSIATSVFGRGPDFNPDLDSIVRIEAGRLRRSIDHYYLTAGGADALRISIPKGSYAPVFTPAQSSPAEAVLGVRTPPIPQALTNRRGPAVFVMNFEEEGDQSAFPNFTRGLTRLLIVGLTRFTDLFVYGSETTKAFGNPGDAKKFVADNAIDFILTGGTTISADHFSLDVMLIDASTGRSVWAESFERTLAPTQIFSARDEVAGCVVRALAQPYGVIASNLAHETDGLPPASMSAYECVSQFYQYWRSFDRNLFDSVRAGLESAIEEYPDYAEAFACLSHVYCDAFRFGYANQMTALDLQQRALTLAHRAIELAPGSSRAHHALGLAYWFAGDVRAGMEALSWGRNLNPNDLAIMADLGQRYAILADWDNAVPLLEASFALNPAQPGNFRLGLALYHYAHGRYEEALSQAARVDAPNVVYGHIMVAIAAAKLGRAAAADAAVSRILSIDPMYSDHLVTDLTARNVHPELIDKVVEGLRAAGLSGRDASAA